MYKRQVWDILDKAYEHFGVFPTLLERDFNIPPVPEMLKEVAQIRHYQDNWKSAAQGVEQKTSADVVTR